jgi:hypothetical protein
MWQVYVFSFLAGVVGVNGVPHFIKGVTGQKHQTPFAQSSSATVNVCWGWANFVVAGLLLYKSHYHAHLLRAFGMFAIAALLMAILLAESWSKNPGKK